MRMASAQMLFEISVSLQRKWIEPTMLETLSLHWGQ